MVSLFRLSLSAAQFFDTEKKAFMQALRQLSWVFDRFRIPTSLLIAIFAAFVIMLARIVAVDSPVMASDEYAYFANAKYVAVQEELYRLDPAMQPVDNKLYPALYAAWAGVSPERAQLVGRIFNSLLFVIGAIVLYGVFIRLFDRKTALVSSLLYLAMPFSFYATTLLPEVEFQLCLYLLALSLVCGGRRPGYAVIALAAAFGAVGYLFKPHAIAAILAAAGYLFLAGFAAATGSLVRRALSGLGRAVAFLGISLGLVYICNRLLGHAPSSGGAGFVHGSYAAYLDRLGSIEYLWSNIRGMLDYVGGHVWVLLILFAPGMALLLVESWRWLRNYVLTADPSTVGTDGEDDGGHQRFAVYIILLTVTLLAMIAAFTQSAASASDFERYRLHGRYLEPLLPFLLAYSVWACSKVAYRWSAAVAVVALITFVWLGRRLYKLYPWDYPDVFGFFTPSLTHWGLPGAAAWTVWLILSIGLVCWPVYYFGRRRLLAYAAFVLAVFLASHVQMSRWLSNHNETSGQVVDAAEGLKDFMGAVPPGSGLVLTSNRYGETSFLLMALDSLQYVMAIGADETFGMDEVPAGVSWVVAPQTSQIEFPGAAELRFGNQKLYLLDGRYQWPVIGEKTEWRSAVMDINTGTSGALARLHGFNDPEEWGSWSHEQGAYIELPAMVSGKVQLSFFGWVPDNHPDRIVRVKLGNAYEDVRMTNKGADYRLTLDTGVPTDRLWFETYVVKLTADPRGLGVAIAGVKLERAPDRASPPEVP